MIWRKKQTRQCINLSTQNTGGKANMNFKRFEVIRGNYIEEIYGQVRLGYSLSDNTDFYDMLEWLKKGDFQGQTLVFYDYTNGKVYDPFVKQKNVLYGKPVYLKNYYWFLQGDFNSEKITLFKYFPGKLLEPVTQLKITEIELYNLRIIGEDVRIISEDNEFICYYPESFSFPKKANETVSLISDDKVYLDAWIEEGWDDEHNRTTQDYKYYEKGIIRDSQGNLVSEKLGCIQQRPDGTWWLA